jgi:zinc transport system substrate-binding protein
MKTMTTRLLVIFLFIITFLLTGCNEEKQESEQSATLQVYTTVYPLQFFTEKIGGDFVDVDTVYPPGADEHTFEPSQKDMINLAESDLFIYIGLGLEGFVDKSLNTLKNEKVALLGAGENIHFDDEHSDDTNHDEGTHEDDGHNHDSIDPHVWIDPIYAKDLAFAIKEQLINKMPEQKQVFEENYQDLASQLEDLDTKFMELVSNSKHKEIIVAHSAYGYWQERYGIEQISISGLATSDEPSQKELQNIIKYARDNQLKYVLYEQNFQSKLAETVKNELDAQSLTLHNLSVLTENDIKNGETYFTLMEQNLESLTMALNE